MSLAAPQIQWGKHCFIPCPPERCNCGRGAGVRNGAKWAEILRRQDEEKRRAEIEWLITQGRDAEALALALDS
jgi:hypothetical protein